MTLQDAIDGVLRNDGIRIDETEHAPGGGCEPGIARCGATSANTADQPHSSAFDEGPDNRRSVILAAVIRHDDLERGIWQPEITRRNARRSSHARENGLDDLADQGLLVSRRNHEGETRLRHQALRSIPRRPMTGLAELAAPVARTPSIRPSSPPGGAHPDYRSAGSAC